MSAPRPEKIIELARAANLVCVEPRNYVPMSLDEIVAHYDALEKA